MNKRFTLTILLALVCMAVAAQQRNITLNLHVASVEGDYLSGQTVVLKQTEWDISYGQLELDDEGRCTVRIYPGQHNVTVERDGFLTATKDFNAPDGAGTIDVELTLAEKTRLPFALHAATEHDAATGSNTVTLSWNVEQPAFFDDFESYPDWAVSFGDWTGIDADQEAAAALLGFYPNRGIMQYAQIINPLTVEPTWWYDYPILRPFSGSQYVGFTRTSSGRANDDWLISPAISVGTENVLSFVAKASDQYAERFMVYACELTDERQGTTQADFTRLDQGNYESVTYEGWREFNYDLSQYAGKQIKFAIRYIGEYNRFGSFMLMVDDVYVGQADAIGAFFARRAHHTATTTRGTAAARRADRRSPANPNEHFVVYLDGQEVGDTYDYTYVLSNVQPGDHQLGVKAVYKAAETEVVTLPLSIAADIYSQVTFNVTANSQLSPDGQVVSLVNTATSQAYTLTVAGGQATLPSLPNGTYIVNVAEGAFEAYQQTIEVTADCTFSIELTDRMLAPYNITAKNGDDGSLTLRWNQELIFSDSFEAYDDFATGSFGGWLSVDRDQLPVYPIALGSASNIVSFPGSGTANNPRAIAPMVFNPWHTTPAMLPTDKAVAAPTGDKTVVFFSPQRAMADKWLISPLLDIHKDYKLSVTAKGYDANYPEEMEFCVSEGGTQPDDFTVLSIVDPVVAGAWSLYETDLSAYDGKSVRLAIHYTSSDAFFVQVDDFTVGPASGEGEVVDYGNVVRYDIYLDGQKVGESQQPFYVFDTLTPGQHTIGVKAVYKNGESEMTEYSVDIASGIGHIETDGSLSATQARPVEYYTLQGTRLSRASQARGVLLMKQGNVIKKINRQ